MRSPPMPGPKASWPPPPPLPPPDLDLMPPRGSVGDDFPAWFPAALVATMVVESVLLIAFFHVCR